MTVAKRFCLLVLLAPAALGCQRAKTVTAVDEPVRLTLPSTFDGSKAGDERKVAGVTLCWCPPGTFTMGSPPDESP